MAVDESVEEDAILISESQCSRSTRNVYSSSTVATTSTQDTQENLEQVNVVLRPLRLGPVRISHTRSHKAIVKTYLAATNKITRRFQRVTKRIITPSVSSCKWCHTLVRHLPARLKEARTKRERMQILTTVPNFVTIPELEQIFKEGKCTNYEAKQASKLRNQYGPFYAEVSVPTPRSLPEETKTLVEDFYLDEANCKILKGERNTVMVTKRDGTKKRESKMLLLMSLRELFEEFKIKHEQVQIGLTSFSLLKPRNCVWPGPAGHHVTCVCVVHENFRLLCEVAGFTEDVEALLAAYICEEPTDECFLGYCAECPKFDAFREELSRKVEEEELHYYLWLTTDRMDLVETTESKSNFVDRFTRFFPKIAAHHFRNQKQMTFIDSLSDQLKSDPTCLIVQVDFGMNYAFIAQNEPQSMHFSGPQSTVHPFVVRRYDQATRKEIQMSYIVLSDELRHETNTFYAFQCKVIAMIKADFPFVTKIYYVSDGSAAQYKNFKNLANLVAHKSDFGLDAEWHFTETAHGKGRCDAMTAVVKRECRRESLKPGRVMTNVDQMGAFCVNHWRNSTTIKILLVKKEEVQSHSDILKQRYKAARKMPGIQKCHSFVPVSDTEVHVREYSSSRDSQSFHVFTQQTNLDQLESLAPVGSYITFVVSSSFQLGVVYQINANEGIIVVEIMKRFGRQNKFRCPDEFTLHEVPFHDYIATVQEPTEIPDSPTQFSLSSSELSRVKDVLARMREQSD